MHQKCSNYAFTNLLFNVCRSVWITDRLVTRPNPHFKAPTCPFTPEVLQDREHTSTPCPFVIFTFRFTIEYIKKFESALVTWQESLVFIDQHALSRLCVLHVCKKWTVTPLYVPSCHAFAKDMLTLCHWHCHLLYHHLDLYFNRLLICLHSIVFLFALQLAKLLLALENLLSKFVKLLLVL